MIQGLSISCGMYYNGKHYKIRNGASSQTHLVNNATLCSQLALSQWLTKLIGLTDTTQQIHVLRKYTHDQKSINIQ